MSQQDSISKSDFQLHVQVRGELAIAFESARKATTLKKSDFARELLRKALEQESSDGVVHGPVEVA